MATSIAVHLKCIFTYLLLFVSCLKILLLLEEGDATQYTGWDFYLLTVRPRRVLRAGRTARVMTGCHPPRPRRSSERNLRAAVASSHLLGELASLSEFLPYH